MGIIQRAMVRSCPHVWFERSEMKDRHLVTKRFIFHSLTSTFLSGLLLGSRNVLSSKQERVCFGMLMLDSLQFRFQSLYFNPFSIRHSC